jgi:hypothetical protein
VYTTSDDEEEIMTTNGNLSAEEHPSLELSLRIAGWVFVGYITGAKDRVGVYKAEGVGTVSSRRCPTTLCSFGEDYMISDAVWREAHPSSDLGFLCVACLERRLGRELGPRRLHRRAGQPLPVSVGAAA